MKNTDKVTLTVGQLKRFIAESRSPEQRLRGLIITQGSLEHAMVYLTIDDLLEVYYQSPQYHLYDINDFEYFFWGNLKTWCNYFNKNYDEIESKILEELGTKGIRRQIIKQKKEKEEYRYLMGL